VYDRVATVTISRAHKANSLPQHAKAALATTVERFGSDDAVDAIVVTGEGERAFCAGSDINEMRTFGMLEMDRMLSDERAMYLAALTCPKPVIAAVNGFALGAGLILAMSCDYAVAAPHASFGAPELSIGVAAPLEGFLLPYFVGLARARAMFYTGNRVDAEEAVAIGLINEVTASERLADRATQVARAMASLPADGFAIQKGLLHRLVSTGDLEATMRESHHLTSRQFAGGAVGEAMARFLAGRTSSPSTTSNADAVPNVDPQRRLEDRLPPEESAWLSEEAKNVATRADELKGSAAWTKDQS
jgi:enoyl-CoA hydratase/carnithine racemase